MANNDELQPQGELLTEATIRKFRIVQSAGTRQVGRLVEGFLDNSLADVELPILSHGGNVSCNAALECANEQYDHFAGKRRIAGQQQADQHYIDDLKKAVETLNRHRVSDHRRTDRPVAGLPGRPGEGRRQLRTGLRPGTRPSRDRHREGCAQGVACQRLRRHAGLGPQSTANSSFGGEGMSEGKGRFDCLNGPMGECMDQCAAILQDLKELGYGE